MKAFRPSVAWFFIYKRQVLINVGSAFSKPFVTHPSLVLKHEGHGKETDLGDEQDTEEDSVINAY